MCEFDDPRQPGDAQEGERAETDGQTPGSGFTSREPGREETNLSDMEPQAAREYVLAYIRTLKETQQAISKVQEEVALWQNRIRLAGEQNRADLKVAAEDKKAGLEAKLSGLRAEEADLLNKVAVLKENLKKLKNTFQYSIDAEQLLASLQMLIGERDILKDKFKDQDAEAELEKLKARLREERGETS